MALLSFLSGSMISSKPPCCVIAFQIPHSTAASIPASWTKKQLFTDGVCLDGITSHSAVDNYSHREPVIWPSFCILNFLSVLTDTCPGHLSALYQVPGSHSLHLLWCFKGPFWLFSCLKTLMLLRLLEGPPWPLIPISKTSTVKMETGTGRPVHCFQPAIHLCASPLNRY